MARDQSNNPDAAYHWILELRIEEKFILWNALHIRHSKSCRSQDIQDIGEAARRISPATQAAYPQIPWGAMIGMRNMLIHDYDDVDLETVWQTVQRDLQDLITLIEPLLPPKELWW